MSDDGSSSDISLDQTLKVTIVGDQHVGKTALFRAFATNSFPHSYEPTLFDKYDTTVRIDGLKFSLSVWDTSSRDEGDLPALRRFAYADTDCFIVCFLLNDKESYSNVENKWIPELQEQCPRAAVVLTGTMSDLVPGKLVARAERFGQRLQSKTKAFSFIPCSAKLRKNVDSVLKASILAIVENNSQHVGFCNFL